jgi:multiple sugar transport system substrate-binding protein
MGFKKHDKQTFIADSAAAFGGRKITKREFLRRMGIAGVGFSAFSLAMLGNTRPFRNPGLISRANAALPDDQVKFLKEVGGQFKGAKIRYTSEATPPTVVLNQIKNEFTDLTGIEVEVEIVPLEQVLAKATQDVQGQLGTYDLYYLDQSWVAGKLVGVPFDIPIFVLMYRKDLLEKHGIKVPTNYEEFTAAAHAIHDAEKSNGIFGTGLQAKSGHYSLECDWTQAVWGHGGSIFNKDKKFAGNDEQGIKGLEWYQDLLTVAPPNSTAATWDGQFQMMQSGQVALVQSWDEFFPGLDADDSKVKGLWEAAQPLKSSVGLRSTADVGFGEIPNLGHQGGSIMGLSAYSKNQEAAWIFMQWACSKEIMTQCTLAGGFAPMRESSFADERVKAKAKVMPGTTRHLDIVKWTIDNVMASEPDMPLWAGLSTNEIPTELGKLLTGQAYDGSAKACMDAVAQMVDAAVKDAEL